MPSNAYALVIVAVGFERPLTPLEKAPAARRRQAGYAKGFVDRYLTGVLYPARPIGLARTVVASAIVASHAGLLVKHRQVIARRGLAARRSEALIWAI